jgi:hypothetical protein
MKNITIIIALLIGFTSCNAQIPTDYLGKYKASLDSKNLLATLADPASDTSTASSVTVKRINGSPDVAEFQKEAQRKAQELIDSYTSKGYILDSSSMSMKTKAYGIITIKRNSIENENPMTKKTEVLYRWKDSDVSCLESGYSIKTYEGTTITLERINATDIRIPELYLILSTKLK